MNIKKIMSFIALAIFSSSIVFANQNDEKSLEKNSFDAANNEPKKQDLDIKKEIFKPLEISDEDKVMKKNSFAYLNLQSIFFLPEIGMGYRHRKNNFGYDLNFSIDPVFTHEVKLPVGTISGSLINYLKSKNDSNYYFSYGIASSYPFVLTAPFLSFGKQFDKSFVQIKIFFPIFYHSQRIPKFPDAIIPIPIPSLSVGFAF